jgi:murein DD-endopeptidase MepM/ murein hydrolase activator NlpD
MVIPERTRRVHKIVVPYFLVKAGLVLAGLVAVFVIILGVDYLRVLSSLSENKRLRGENFKLRQEIQLIRNKVDSMQWTIERVRNYAKKLQLLTGQGEKGVGNLLDAPDRDPAARSKRERHSSRAPMPQVLVPLDPESTLPVMPTQLSLGDRVDRLQLASLTTETSLSLLQEYMLARRAVMRATPSLVPITGYISSAFGYRNHPLMGTYRMHAGVDIAAEPGTPVHAPADGLVIFSGYKEGYGKVSVFDHGYKIRTLFGHNSKLYVNSGVKVRRGDIISLVGSTGMSTGPHLHYEVRKNGVPVNPVTFFSLGRF